MALRSFFPAQGTPGGLSERERLLKPPMALCGAVSVRRGGRTLYQEQGSPGVNHGNWSARGHREVGKFV